MTEMTLPARFAERARSAPKEATVITAALAALLLWLPLQTPLAMLAYQYGHLPVSTTRGVLLAKDLLVVALLLYLAARHIRAFRWHWFDYLGLAYGVLLGIYVVGPQLLGTEIPFIASMAAARDFAVPVELYLLGRLAIVAGARAETLVMTFLGSAALAALFTVSVYLLLPTSFWETSLDLVGFVREVHGRIGAMTLFDISVVGNQGGGVVTRAVGPFVHPVGTGTYFVPPLLLAAAGGLAALRAGLARRQVLLWMAGAGLFAAAVIVPISRGAWIASGLGLLICALLYRRVWLAIVLLAMAAALVLAVPQFRDSLLSAITLSDGSAALHRSEVQRGISVVLEHPLGLGLGQADAIFAGIAGPDGGGGGENVGENMYLAIAASVGVLGLLVFVGWLVGVATSLLPRGQARAVDWPRVAILASLAGLAVASMTASPFMRFTTAASFWLVVGLLVANDAPRGIKFFRRGRRAPTESDPSAGDTSVVRITATPRWRRAVAMSTLFALLAIPVISAPAVALPAPAVLPSGFAESLVVEELPGDGDISDLEFAPDGRLFIALRSGEIWDVTPDARGQEPMLEVPVSTDGTEQGLVGMTFDPSFASNGHLYVSYTAVEPVLHQRISRFTAEGAVADPESELVLLELDELHFRAPHVGGGMVIGADGMLYVGVGDTGVAERSQSLLTSYGKVLRIETDGTIPRDNPFYSRTDGVRRATWALGLRNPFSLAIDRTSGTLMINDVGEVGYEEINRGVAGANYGWPQTEGYTRSSRYEGPLHAYGRASGCAVVGGAFYDPPDPTFPDPYIGQYFFMDLCSYWIRMLDPETGSVTTFADGLSPLPGHELLGPEVGPDGAIYWANRAANAIYRIQYTGLIEPQLGEGPRSVTVQAGTPASFEVRASGDLLSYQWQRDGVDIEGEVGWMLTLPAPLLADSGSEFRAIVESPLGRIVTPGVTLTVLPPSASYRGGPPTQWQPGETKTYSVEITNTGPGAWNAGGDNFVRLGVQFGTASDVPGDGWVTDQRFSLPGDVAPGESVVVPVTVTAPERVGDYVLHHRVLKELVIWFDDPQMTPVSVRAPIAWGVLLILSLSVVLMLAVAGVIGVLGTTAVARSDRVRSA